MKQLYNKQNVECAVCARTFQRGGKARHISTRVHKKAVRALKRKAKAKSKKGKKKKTKQS